MPARSRVFAALLALAAAALGAVAAAAEPPAATPSATQSATPAEAPPADPKAAARAHFEKARALADEGVWPAALAEFLASRQLYATWGNTLGAATSLRKLGRFDEALDLFEVLLKDLADTMPERFKTAAQRELIELRGLVGTVDVEGAEIGATLVVDGRDRGTFPSPGPLRVAAGSHLVRVSRGGFLPFEARIDVAGGQSVRLAARLQPIARSGRLRVADEGGRALDVIVDGDVVGKSPWEGALAAGDHVVVLRGAGDLGTQPVSVPVQLDRTAALTLPAEELAAAVRIEPTPVNATVAIDSVAVGRGIWEGRLRAGPHKIEVAAGGFSAGVREIRLARGERQAVAVALQRDPSSPFWRKPPRPAHFILELDGAAAVVPSMGGDVVGGCAGACSAAPGVGVYAALRGGYELSSGFGVGLTLGYLFAGQTANGRAASLAPVGATVPDAGTVSDTVALHRGGLGGAWVGFSVGERFPVHLRASGGMAFATVTDTRSGTFASQGAGPMFDVGPVTLSSFTLFGYAAPELRVGVRLGAHFELNAGAEALVLFPLSHPSWDAKHPINAGPDGIGTFPAEGFLGRALFAIAPGLGLRYEF
jgi:PEGA domain